LRYTIMIVLCIIMSTIVSFKPKWMLTVIFLFMLFLGMMLIVLAQNKELAEQFDWDPGMLGAGVSIVALAITFFSLFISRDRKG
jgi:hypothetical protein